ncbi:MAG TPA: VCBS repeat-containing protein [Candidatus Angelobacter sp.]
MTARRSRLQLVAISMALTASFVWAQDGMKGALAQTNFTAPFGRSLAVADLDGDNQPDGAVLLRSGWPGTSGNFKIQLHFTGHTNVELAFQSKETALAVTAWDIDNDGDTDLVVEENMTHKPLRVWINDGNGEFHEGRVQDFPSLAPGTQEHLRLPANQPDRLVLCLPPQRGFELPILTAGLLARPPSKNSSNAVWLLSSIKVRTLALNSSRAPPLS